MGGVVPDYTKYVDDSGSFEAHKAEVDALLQTYITDLRGTKLRAGLTTILGISGSGNKLLQDNKLSNQLITEEPERCAAVVGHVLNLLHLLANLVFPYMPGTSEAIFEQLGLQPSPEGKFDVCIPDTWQTDFLKPGHALGEPKLLFAAIPASKLDEWREAFGGEELKKQKEAEAEKAAAKKAAKEKEKERKRNKKLANVQAAAGASTPIPAPAPSDEAGKADPKPRTPAPRPGPVIDGKTTLVHRDKV